jgi:plastocyanin
MNAFTSSPPEIVFDDRPTREDLSSGSEATFEMPDEPDDEQADSDDLPLGGISDDELSTTPLVKKEEIPPPVKPIPDEEPIAELTDDLDADVGLGLDEELDLGGLDDGLDLGNFDFDDVDFGDDEDLPGDTSNAKISIKNMKFVPSTITVAKGTTIEIVNDDSVDHTVVSADAGFESPTITPGSKFTVLADEPGTFGYVCGIHPSMTGSVTVE